MYGYTLASSSRFLFPGLGSAFVGLLPSPVGAAAAGALVDPPSLFGSLSFARRGILSRRCTGSFGGPSSFLGLPRRRFGGTGPSPAAAVALLLLPSASALAASAVPGDTFEIPAGPSGSTGGVEEAWAERPSGGDPDGASPSVDGIFWSNLGQSVEDLKFSELDPRLHVVFRRSI